MEKDINIIPNGFKDRLEQFRANLGLTQVEFAEKAGLTKESYKQIKDNPTLQMILKFIQTYPELDVAWIVTGRSTVSENKVFSVKKENEDTKVYELFAKNEALVKHNSEILEKAQAQFDRVLDLFERMVQIGEQKNS